MANTQYLSAIYDAQFGQLLYSPAMVTEWDTTFSCPSAVVAMPGVGGGMNTRGSLPNPLAPRVASLKFFRKYAGTNYEIERDALVGALRNRELRLVVAQPDGTFRQNWGQLTDFADKRDPTTTLIAEFTVKFSIGPQFKSLVPANSPTFDSGLTMDSGVTMDSGIVLALVNTSQTITLTNGGNAPETQGVYTLRGRFDGPIVVANFSDPRVGNVANFIYYGNLFPTDTLVVDSGLGSVTLNGVPVFDPAIFDWGVLGAGHIAQREYLRLLPGANTISVAHPAGGGLGGVFIPQFFSCWE